MILRDNPGIDVIRQALPERVDMDVLDDVIVVRAGEAHWVLRPVWIGEGFPSDLHRADSVFDPPRHNVTDVVTARRMSSGARKELTASGRSWADATGQASIFVAPGLIIERRVSKPTGTPKSKRFSVSTSAVAEAVLSLAIENADLAGNQRIHASQLSELTGYSYPQVNKVLQELESRGYVEKFGAERGVTAERVVRGHSRLLSDWAGMERQAHPRSLGFHSLKRDASANIDSVIRAFSFTGDDAIGMIDWTVTGWFAADHIAPFVTSVPNIACYVRKSHVDAAVSRLTNHADMEPVESGARVSITPVDSVTLAMSRYRDGIPCASPVRVYADLLRIGGRAEEAAQHLRETAIGF